MSEFEEWESVDMACVAVCVAVGMIELEVGTLTGQVFFCLRHERRTRGAVSLQVGKSPGFKLILLLVAISDDSTSCLLVLL